MVWHRAKRRITLVAAFAIGCVAAASPARAATLPPDAVVRLGPSFDAAAFARAIACRYDVVLSRVVAADIDRDGDLDVLATTDRGFTVWVNDGAGRLTSQPPTHSPLLDGEGGPDTWRDGDARSVETIQNDPPSPRVLSSAAHAPPSFASHSTVALDVVRCVDAIRGTRPSRAPPRG